MKAPSKKKYPNCNAGHQYALDVVAEKIPACSFVFASCERYLDDIHRDCFDLRWDLSERFLRMFQCFEHVIGEWKTPNIQLEPWQKFFFMNVELFYWKRTGKRRFKAAHLEVPRGSGKALCLETSIPTPSGMRRFGDIKIGDKIYDRNGGICNVVGETPVHFPDQYDFTLANGLKIRTSSKHQWFTTNSTERGRKSRHNRRPPVKKQKNISYVYESVKTTNEIVDTLSHGGRSDSNHHILLADPICGEDNGNLYLDPWVLGYWLGNGSVDRGSSTCHSADAEELASIFRAKGHSTSLLYSNSSKSCTVKSLGVLAPLKKLGVSRVKAIPEQYLSAPFEVRLELLRGLLDSDGSISSDRLRQGTVEFCTVSESFASQVLRLVTGLGIKANVGKSKIRSNFNTNNEFHYDVCFTPLCDDKVFLLKRKARLQRGVRSFTSTNKHVIRSAEKIDHCDRVPMKCIEVDSPDSSYLITEYHIPTHNSAMASVTGLIYLNLVETVKGNKVYSCATKKDQARIVLDSARKMASGNKQYLRGTGTEVFAHHIAHEKTGSEFRALSSDANSLDGLQPVLAIIDELHAHKTRDLYDVVDSAMSKRRDSFLLVITTAGNDITGIGYSQSEYAKKVAIGDLDDDSFMSLVYTLDKEDDWMDPLSWEKANPNWGISVDEDSFKNKALKAINNPADMINFKIKHLNLWQNTLSRFFSVDKWDELGNKLLSFDEMRGEKCYVGVDLATKVDMVAIAYVFKNKETGRFKIFVDSFCPEDTVAESKNNMYPVWVESGELIATPGAAVGLSALREGFVKKARTVRAAAIHYDPWNATEFGQELAKNRFDAVEFKMSTGNLSEPMKKLEELIRDGLVEHDGSSLLSWCLGNVVAKYDANDNVFPRKNHESMKIDQIVAILMALAGWVAEEENESVYATRGIRTI